MRVDCHMENYFYKYEYVPIFNKLFGMGAATIKHFTYGRSGHNIWIESLMEIGIIGISILGIFYIVFILKSFKMGEHIVFACFMGYIIMTLSMSLYSYKPIWNILLLILILKTVV